MKRLLVITGFIAVGKSTFLKSLNEKVPMVSLQKDTIKEQLAEQVGFTNRAENRALSKAAVRQMITSLPQLFLDHDLIAIEANFTKNERSLISEFAEHAAIKLCTVWVTCDPKIAYQRYQKRYNHLHPAHRAAPMIDEAQFITSFSDYERAMKDDYQLKINTSSSATFNDSAVLRFVSNREI